MNVKEFIETFKSKKIMNTKIDPNAVDKYIRENLEIREYVPFKEKREVAEMVVAANTKEVDGVLKNDAINQYVSFVVAMIKIHTSLEFGDNPIDDYDVLAENGLLVPIIETFQADYNECDIVLKMEQASVLEDNNVNVLVGKFLNGLFNKIDGLFEIVKSIDIKDILGADFKEEDLAKLSGFLNKYQ